MPNQLLTLTEKLTSYFMNITQNKHFVSMYFPSTLNLWTKTIQIKKTDVKTVSKDIFISIMYLGWLATLTVDCETNENGGRSNGNWKSHGVIEISLFICSMQVFDSAFVHAGMHGHEYLCCGISVLSCSNVRYLKRIAWHSNI